MNESSNRRYVIVGIFVFIGLIFLLSGILIVGDLNETFERKIEVVSLFDDVAGLQRGNNIWLSGVKVGTVSKLEFYGNSKVKVTMQIETRAKQFIHNDSKVRISSDGLIGNRILVIYGGSEIARNLQEGDTLRVEKTITSEDMLGTLQKTNENILAITSDLKMISKRIVDGEGSVGKLLNDNSTFDNVNAATKSLQQIMVDAKQLVNTLAVFSSGFNKEGTLINELTTDTTVFIALKSTVLQLQQIADTASVFVEKLKKDGSNPKSSLGVLLSDEESGARVKETIKNLESSSKKLDEDLEALKHSSLLKGYFKKKN